MFNGRICYFWCETVFSIYFSIVFSFLFGANEIHTFWWTWNEPETSTRYDKNPFGKDWHEMFQNKRQFIEGGISVTDKYSTWYGGFSMMLSMNTFSKQNFDIWYGIFSVSKCFLFIRNIHKLKFVHLSEIFEWSFVCDIIRKNSIHKNDAFFYSPTAILSISFFNIKMFFFLFSFENIIFFCPKWSWILHRYKSINKFE